MLLIHKPWCAKNKLDNKNASWTRQFVDFLTGQKCPKSVKVAYERAKFRSKLLKTGKYREPVASKDREEEIENNPCVDEETKDIVDLLTTVSNSIDPEIILKGIVLNRGLRITEVSN